MLKYLMIVFILSCKEYHRPPKVVSTINQPNVMVSYDSTNKIDRALLLRGQDRYEIHCESCHGTYGEGQRIQNIGPPVPSIHNERLRKAAPDYFYDVITYGKGKMSPFGSRISQQDRWAIAYYVRMLQLTAELEKKNK